MDFCPACGTVGRCDCAGHTHPSLHVAGVQGAEPPAVLDTDRTKATTPTIQPTYSSAVLSELAAAGDDATRQARARQRGARREAATTFLVGELLALADDYAAAADTSPAGLCYADQARTWRKRATRYAQCSRSGALLSRSCATAVRKGSPHVLPLRCDLPGCPQCAGINARERAQRLAREAGALWRCYGRAGVQRASGGRKGYHLAMLTFTLARVCEPSASQIAADASLLWDAFGRWWRAAQTIDGAPLWSSPVGPEGPRRPEKLRHAPVRGSWIGPEGPQLPRRPLRRATNPHIGMHCELEVGAGANVHLHALWLGPWLAGRPRRKPGKRAADARGQRRRSHLSELWLAATTAVGRPSPILDVRAPYFYASAADRDAGRKTYALLGSESADAPELERVCVEAAKYLSVGAEKIARVDGAPLAEGWPVWLAALIALRGRQTSRSYGCWRGESLQVALRECAAAEPEPPCPYCRIDCGWLMSPIVPAETLEQLLVAPRPPPGRLPLWFTYFDPHGEWTRRGAAAEQE